MGKAIKDAKVQVSGEAGPLGEGVPLTQAVGPGGLSGVATGKPLAPNTQVPGMKGLLERARAAGKMKGGVGVPRSGLFGRAFNQMQNKNPRGGIFGRFQNFYKQNKQANPGLMAPPGQPAQPPQPTGGLGHKPSTIKPGF